METVNKIKERPILFSAPMVRAILEGRKTVTRRAVKATKAHADGFMMLDHGNGWWPYNAFGDFTSDHEGMEYPIACPYGKPGDRLWVRESHAQVFEVDIPDGRPVGPIGTAGSPGRPDWKCRYVYRADGQMPNVQWHHVGDSQPVRWTPSIHMPRHSSRILLEITDVRVQRLRDSDDLVLLDELGDMLEDSDSVAGREFSRVEHFQCAGAPLRMLPEMYGFLAWWDKTNGHGSFDSNPWVWVVEFKRVTP